MAMTDDDVLAFEADIEKMKYMTVLAGVAFGVDVTDEKAIGADALQGLTMGAYSILLDVQRVLKKYI